MFCKTLLKRQELEREIIKIGRTMYWDKVAQNYIQVIISIINSVPKIEVVS